MTTISKKAPVPRKKTVRKKPAAKKGKTRFSAAWKIAVAGLMLILLSPFYYGYVLKAFSSSWKWMTDIGENPDYRTYDHFNINIPSKYSIHGIDVSSYQGKINWRKVRDMQDEDVRIKFAFIKATEGVMHVDPYFQRNWREAPKAGIVCGAYHYFKPNKSGKWQARFFLQTAKPEKGDLPLVVDVEELKGVSPEKMRKELKAFVGHLEDKTSVKPIIYTGISFYRDYLHGHFDKYPLWIAHYYKSELKTGKNIKWNFWQHSDKARIDGIYHVVDMNVFQGDSVAFQKLLIQ